MRPTTTQDSTQATETKLQIGTELVDELLREASQPHLLIPPRPSKLRLDQLQLDDAPDGYQRDLGPRGERYVARIVRNFDLNLLMPLVVNRRVDGSYWVIDGGHRLKALRQLGWTEVDVWLYEGLSREQEAGLYASQQRDRRGVSAVNLAKAEIVKGQEDAVGVARILDRHGFSLETERDYPRYQDGAWVGNVVAVATIRNLYQSAGEAILDQVVATLDAVWGKTQPKAYGASILIGLTALSSTPTITTPVSARSVSSPSSRRRPR